MQQRIFKLFKENGILNFSTLLYTYKTDRYTNTKNVTQKIESPANQINETTFIEKLSKLSMTSDFLHPNTLWSSIDNKSFIISEPASIKNIYIKNLKKEFKYPHPNVIYYITKTATDKPYVAGMWFYLEDKITPTTIFYPAWILNIFKTGFVCTHNVIDNHYPDGVDYNVLINTAIEDFWNGNFNVEVSDLAKAEVLTKIKILTILDYKDYVDYFFSQLNALAKNYTIKSNKSTNTFLYIANYYYNSGPFHKVVNSIIKNNPQTQLTSNTTNKETLSNNYLISDIVSSAYSS